MSTTEGLRKIAEGREAEMFAWEGGAILRLMRDPQAQARLQWEATALKAAQDRGIRVPAVLELTTVMGRPGMVMERLQGLDMLTVVGRQPWKVWWAGRVLGEIHAQLAGIVAPRRMVPLNASIRTTLESSPRVPRDVAGFALPLLDGLPDGDKLCHGDFHPANVIVTPEGPAIIDWTNARRGTPDADLARTLVMLRLGTAPPSSSPVIRYGAGFARNILLSAYLRAYRRGRPFDAILVRRWEIVRAADRLAEEIEDERAGVLRFVERARRRIE